jgi:hypothetical protein
MLVVGNHHHELRLPEPSSRGKVHQEPACERQCATARKIAVRQESVCERQEEKAEGISASCRPENQPIRIASAANAASSRHYCCVFSLSLLFPPSLYRLLFFTLCLSFPHLSSHSPLLFVFAKQVLLMVLRFVVATCRVVLVQP